MMKCIYLFGKLTYDDELMHGNEPEAMKWFYNLLETEELLLHSNEIGDTVGTFKVEFRGTSNGQR